MRCHSITVTLSCLSLAGCAFQDSASPESGAWHETRSSVHTPARPSSVPSWSIQYEGPIVPRGKDYHIVDLFDVSDSDLATLKAQGTRPIAYFSSQYEEWRRDSSRFPATDLRGSLDGWKGERWVNTHSPDVRQIMLERMDYARKRGFYGVDCDNVDFYEFANSGGSASDAVDYVRFLANAAHTKNLKFGLKNATGIITSTMDVVDYYVNEEAHQYGDTEAYAGVTKPVLNIEYQPLSKGTLGMYTIYKAGAVMDGREVYVSP